MKIGNNALSLTQFVPFVILTTSNLGGRATDWIDSLARVSSLPAQVFKTFLARQLSVSLATSLHLAAEDFQRRVLASTPTSVVIGR